MIQSVHMALAEGQRIGRREFIAAALGLTAGVAGKALIDKYTPVFATETREHDLLAESEQSPLLVAKGVNLRTEPLIPARSRIYQRDNTIPWDSIKAVNGVPLGNKDAFVILNSQMVYGQEVDRNWYRSNRWGIVDATMRNDSRQTIYFNSESEAVRSLYDYTVDRTALVWPPKIIPVSKETAAREVLPSLWAADVRAKLDGFLPLDTNTGFYQGEIVYNQVAVVPSGMTEVDRQQNATVPVSVRNFPDTRYGTGEPVTVVGKVPMGTNIDNVLLTRGSQWGAFRARDIEGDILDPDGKPINTDQDSIYTIHANYLLTTDHVTYLPQPQR